MPVFRQISLAGNTACPEITSAGLCVFSDKTVVKEDTYGSLVTESKHLVKRIDCFQTCKTIAYFLSKTERIKLARY